MGCNKISCVNNVEGHTGKKDNGSHATMALANLSDYKDLQKGPIKWSLASCIFAVLYTQL